MCTGSVERQSAQCAAHLSKSREVDHDRCAAQRLQPLDCVCKQLLIACGQKDLIRLQERLLNTLAGTCSRGYNAHRPNPVLKDLCRYTLLHDSTFEERVVLSCHITDCHHIVSPHIVQKMLHWQNEMKRCPRAVLSRRQHTLHGILQSSWVRTFCCCCAARAAEAQELWPGHPEAERRPRREAVRRGWARRHPRRVYQPARCLCQMQKFYNLECCGSAEMLKRGNSRRCPHIESRLLPVRHEENRRPHMPTLCTPVMQVAAYPPAKLRTLVVVNRELLQQGTSMMRATAAPSEMFCANTVTQSSALAAGTTPRVDSRPTVGLMPTQPLNMAGTRPAAIARLGFKPPAGAQAAAQIRA